jgi:drug/metabolite transporter (DMT)-like permease
MNRNVILKRYYLNKDNNDKNTNIISNINDEMKNIYNINDKINDNNNTLIAYFLLNLVAIIYGTQHPLIKISMDSYPSTSLVNFWRFLLSSLLFLPVFLKMIYNNNTDINNNDINNDDINNNNDDINKYKAGIELGIYTFLGFAFQAIGLETTTASRSAFLLYLNVKFVPFLGLFLFKRSIHPLNWISAAFALVGTSLLSTTSDKFNIGDLWCIGAAIASAMFILRLDTYSKCYNAAQLNSITFVTVTFLCGLWVIGDMIYNINLNISNIFIPFIQNPWIILYLGIITTGICNYIQTIGQKTIPAEKAAIVYSLDPLYGAFFSWLLLDESLSFLGYIGGILILIGVYITTKIPKEKV